MQSLENFGGAYIVVVQNSQDILDTIRKNVLGSPNHIVFTREPQEAILEVIHCPVDIVITGEKFYESNNSLSIPELINLFHRVKKGFSEERFEATAAELEKQYSPKTAGPSSGTELAQRVYDLNQDVLTLRYSLMPGKQGEIVGDIIKKRKLDDAIYMLLKHPGLAPILRGRTVDGLKAAFPEIQFYDETLAERMKNKRVVAGTAEALDQCVCEYVNAAADMHNGHKEPFVQFFNACSFAANMFCTGLQRQLDSPLPETGGVTKEHITAITDFARKAEWTTPTAIRTLQNRYLELRPAHAKDLILLK